MPDDNKLQSLFFQHQNRLLADLNLSSVHGHPDAKGDNSENAWRKMLTGYLPDRYKVDKGFVIDHEGKFSHYIDIIIYDRYYSPIVFNENGSTYVPAESVFAVIECKPVLNKSYIKYARDKAKSVRDLKRTSAPIRQMNNTMATKVDAKQVLAGIIATKSKWSPAFGKPFKDAITEAAKISPIDFGCALNNGAFSVSYSSEGTPSISISDTENSLISFFVDLVARLQAMGNPPAIDLQKYYQQSQQD
ncbi:hypothetical protein ASD37_19585 [Mycobacterium sp. Root135]|uniref:DUF6602 domain-containing protein n=1 Tax=Mycobacterium sp. Root135 TaxID=1736457 RepID=UPI0006FCB9C2|nr:DUF6602 domain-containing protein [Mycobacterium sp. Root135]KQY06463.1 hypothetical protein ASD37_19585 [Mycobacterium sp. Root135]